MGWDNQTGSTHQDFKSKYEEMAQRYEELVLTLESRSTLFRLKEEKLKFRIASLEAVVKKVKGMADYLGEQTNQLFRGLVKMLLVYDKFSSLGIDARLSSIVSKKFAKSKAGKVSVHCIF